MTILRGSFTSPHKDGFTTSEVWTDDWVGSFYSKTDALESTLDSQTDTAISSSGGSKEWQKVKWSLVFPLVILVGIVLLGALLIKNKTFLWSPSLFFIDQQVIFLSEPAKADVEQPGEGGSPKAEDGLDVEPSDDWGLPTVEQAETRLPYSALRGKQFLAAAVVAQRETSYIPPDCEQTAAVADVLTRRSKKSLIGEYLHLENVTSLDGSDSDNATLCTVKVTKLLGKGASKVVLEVLDEATQMKFALLIYTLEKLSIPPETVAALEREALLMEKKSIRKACEGIPAAFAASHRGYAVPSYTARLESFPELTLSGKFYVFNEVLLMQRLNGDLERVIAQMRHIPLEVKEYIAHRLLLQVLHLQKAGVSHNDLRLDNCLMCDDGSFFLTDFSFSTPFGQNMIELAKISPAYADPTLLIEFNNFLHSDASVRPEPAVDIWALGAILYELFTDGQLPYGVTDIHNDLQKMCSRAQELLRGKVSTSDLVSEMQNAGVPPKWQELIVVLLEPLRERRITAREIARKFPDLVGSS